MEYDIIKTLCVLSEREGWTKEANVISWNHREPKVDIREWNSDHSRMTKGITLTADEVKNLYMALNDIVHERSEK